jgi:dihydroorotate dehydrogenase (fumarate)
VPLAVKVGPFYTAFAHTAARLAEAGADGLVLFNRFLQPDIDLETLAVAPALHLSTPVELRLPMRWIAILHGRVGADLAATGGAHGVEDVVKLLLAGADVVELASALLARGPGHLRTLRAGLADWLAAREYASVEQLKGSLSQAASPDPAAFERAQYMRALVSYAPAGAGRRPGHG